LDSPGYFKYDPIKALIDSDDEAIRYFTRRDLLSELVEPVDTIWKLKRPQSILKKQLQGGFWKYPGKGEDYYLLETFKNLQHLVYQYGMDNRHPQIAGASEFLFAHQTEEGDIRGILANQYAPYYTGLMLALLINAGYEDDPRIDKGLQWLLSMRQDDGGWVIGSPGFLGIPNLSWKDIYILASDRSIEPLKSFDKSRPFSHAGTGMVIRAFACNRRHSRSMEAIASARLLKSHFFKEDNYSSYKHADHWVRFQYPFWWNNLVAAMDSLSLMGFPASDPDINIALEWFLSHQESTGLWKGSYSGIHKSSENSRTYELKLWITLSICRIFKRLYG
jgi:hypothetical protein